MATPTPTPVTRVGEHGGTAPITNWVAKPVSRYSTNPNLPTNIASSLPVAPTSAQIDAQIAALTDPSAADLAAAAAAEAAAGNYAVAAGGNPDYWQASWPNGVPPRGVPQLAKDVVPKKTLQQALDDILSGTMTAYGMSGVADTIAQIRADYPDITSDQLLTLMKNDTRYNAAYNARFAGNAALKAKGLQPLDDATYLKSEQQYAKVLSAYGANTLANQGMYATFIGNSMDLQDVTDRLSLAVDHLQANKEANAAFDQFFPSLTMGDKIALMLDPKNQLPIMQKKVQAAEIGGAALAQHLQTNLADITSTTGTGYTNVTGGTLGAETLRAAGVTASGAQTGYQTIAEQLPTATKLSAIYAGTLDQYGQKQAEQEQFLGLASAKRAKEKLSAKEQATWSGQTGQLQSAYGVNRTAFGTSAQGTF